MFKKNPSIKEDEVRRPGELSPKGTWLLALFLVLGLAAAGTGIAETLKVERPNMQLYQAPNFASPVLLPVPVGAEVTVLSRSGDWLQVSYQGKTGYMHQTAFPQTPPPAVGLPGLLTGGPVRETRSDEVALAGKGFTPEVEAAYRQKNPGLNYAQVDLIESFRVDDRQLAAFIKEGGLTP
jgi:hypothetical protein